MVQEACAWYRRHAHGTGGPGDGQGQTASLFSGTTHISLAGCVPLRPNTAKCAAQQKGMGLARCVHCSGLALAVCAIVSLTAVICLFALPACLCLQLCPEAEGDAALVLARQYLEACVHGKQDAQQRMDIHWTTKVCTIGKYVCVTSCSLK